MKVHYYKPIWLDYVWEHALIVCPSVCYLDLLQGYCEQGYEVWLELGLQTAHNKTLKSILIVVMIFNVIKQPQKKRVAEV